MASQFLKVRSGVGLTPNTAPSDPVNGDHYYDSGTNTFQFYQNGVWTGLGATGVTPTWIKYTLSHTAFQVAATTNDLQLFSLPSKAMIHQIVLKHSVAFAGTGVTGYTLGVGIASNFNKYTAAFNVFQSVTNVSRSITQAEDIESFTGATSIRIQATSTGANLNLSTAGSVDVWVLTSALP